MAYFLAADFVANSLNSAGIMNHIRLALDREQIFAEVVMGMDMALERSRGLGLSM